MKEADMEPIAWKTAKVIDAHVHYRSQEPVAHFKEILRLANSSKVNILHGPTRDLKRDAPKTDYAFRMLKQDPEKIAAHDGAYLAEQVDEILGLGFHGIKMMDGKPSVRRTWQPLSLDDDYFKPYWDKAEAIGLPIIIHACDRASRWDPNEEDSYADLGSQEDFFRQTIAVLERNPNLNITFAHFFFMGSRLERLGALFAKYPRMRVDLSLGDEYLFYMSDDPDTSRDFCIQWSDRILYGTDISDGNSLKHGRSKAEALHLFLETDETFELPTYKAMGKPTAVGPNGRSELHGLSLPQEALNDIMWRNFETFVSERGTKQSGST